MPPESAQAYEARLVAFLSANGGSSTVATVSKQCPWVGAAGIKGAYGRFIRERPHLFETFSAGNAVRLRQAAHPAGATRAGNPPAQSTQDAHLAYQRSIVAFLLTQPGRRATFVAVGEHTTRPWDITSFRAFLQRWPAVFRLEASPENPNVWYVSLLGQASAAAGPEAAAPAASRDTTAAAALQQALLAFLARQPGRCASLDAVGQAIARPPSVLSLKAFATERPQLFRLERRGTQWFVSLHSAAGGTTPQASGGAGSGAAAGCVICGSRSFSSTQQRREHERGRPHLLKVAATLLRPKLGVSLTGPPELLSAPGAAASAALLLRNEGDVACQVLRVLLLKPLREVSVQCAGAALLPGSSLEVTLAHQPQQAGVMRIMAVCCVRFANGVEASVGHEMRLRCVDAAAAEDMERMKPTSAYRRPRRPPPPTAAPDTYTGAIFRASPLTDAPYAAATMHSTIAQLLDAVAHGPLGTMIAAWMPPTKPADADTEARAVTATVVMDGVPAADQFGQVHREALSRALGSLLHVSNVTILEVMSVRASIIPGVPIGAMSQGIRLDNVQTPPELRKALDAPAGSPQRDALMARLAVPLSADNHAARFRELLLCEEIQQEQDIRLYDIEHALMRAQGGVTLLLDVPGLAEARPSVLRGDKVVVRGADGGRSYEGVVHAVEQETLQLRFDLSFHRAFIPGMRHHVRFTLRRTPMLLMHAAVAPSEAAADRAALLFPALPADEAAEAAAAQSATLTTALFNRDLNIRQQQAVRAAMCRGADPERPILAPYIIFGPPGTGKTSTVAEYVMQVLATKVAAPAASSTSLLGSLLSGMNLSGKLPPPPEVLILVAAPSNSAVDTVAQRLLRFGLAPSQLLRVNAFQRPYATVPAALIQCSRWSAAESAFTLPAGRDSLRGVRVVAVTCSTAQKLAHSKCGAFLHLFSHVVVDEAGQATEPECLCAVTKLLRPAHAGGARLVLAGDPKQLGPVLRSPVALEAGLGLSLLERMTECESGPHRLRGADQGYPGGFHSAYVTLLTDNYRSHAALLTVPNELFYNGALVPCAKPMLANAFCNWAGLPHPGFPLLFHGVEGEDMREGNSPSWFNPQEAAAVLQHVRDVLAHPGSGTSARDVGVITPYHKQKLKIAELFRRHDLKDVEVGSVENFQGAEKAVIILSAVRSTQEHVGFDTRHALGFLSNPKRFNVAVTRARALLIVVGNPAVLARDACWAALLRHAVRNGAYRGCSLPPAFGGDDDDDDDDDDDGHGSDSDESDDGGGGGGGGRAARLLRRVAAEESARAEAADGDAEAAGRFRAEELPAWNNDA